MPVSYSVPCNVATSDSVHGCAVPFASGDKRTVHYFNTGFNSFEIRHVAGTALVVGMQMDRTLDSLFQLFDKLICLVRKQQIGHILDANRIGSHFLKLNAQASDKIFACMNWTGCI